MTGDFSQWAITGDLSTAFLGAIAEGVTVQDTSGRLVYANDSAARVLGFQSSEELLGNPPLEILKRFVAYDEDGAPFPLEQLPGRQALAGHDSPAAAVMRYTHPDTGERKWSQVKAMPVRDEQGEVKYAVNIFTDITEAKRAGLEAAEHASQLKAVLDTAVAGIVTIDDKGTIKTVNRAACRIFGYGPAEMIERNVSMLMPEPYHSAHDSYIGNYLETGIPKIIGSGREAQGRRKDGSVFPVDLAVSETVINGERTFIGVVTDISLRKSAEQTVTDYAEKLRLAVRAGDIGVWEYDPVADSMEFDARCQEIFAFSPRETFTSGEIIERIHEDDRARAEEILADAIADPGERVIDEEFRLSLPGIENRWISVRAETHVTDTGALDRIVGTLSDVTRRKLDEQALKDSEELFRATFDNAAVGIAHVGIDRRLLGVNQKYCEITGYSEEELVGKDVFEFTAEEDRFIPAEREDLISGAIENMYSERRYIHKSGRSVWVGVTASVRRDSNGEPLYLVSVVEDISVRKRAEMRLTAEHAVSHAIATEPTLDEAAASILDSLRQALNVDIAEIWLPEEPGNRLYCWKMSSSPSFKGIDEWRDLTATVRFDPGEGIPGMAWESKAPQWFMSQSSPPLTKRSAITRELGITSRMGFPLMAGDQRMGVIAMHARHGIDEDEHLHDSLASLGRVIGQYILSYRAEKALTENEERLRLASTAGRVGVWDWDVLTGQASWSEGQERIFGLQPGSFSGTVEDFVSRIHPEDRDFVVNTIQSSTLNDPGHQFEYRALRSDGQVRWVYCDGTAVFDENGALTRVFGVVRDITDAKRKEEADNLLASASRILASSLDYDDTLRRIANICVPSPADWCVVDLVDANGKFHRVTAAHRDPEKEQLAADLGRKYPPDESGNLSRIVKSGEPMLISEVTEAMIDEMDWNDERKREFKELGLTSALGVPLSAGDVVYGVLTMVSAESKRIYDSTDVETAMELGHRCALAIANARLYSDLQASEERYRESFENVAFGITHVNLDGNILAVNRKFCEMTGYDREELIDTPVRDIVFDRVPGDDNEVASLYKGELPHMERERRYRRKDGGILWGKATITVQRDSAGAPLYRISIIEDISSRKLAEMRLEAGHAISQIVAKSSSLDDAAPRLLEALCQALEMDIGELWLPVDEQTMTCSAIHVADSIDDPGRWKRATAKIRFTYGENILGEVWRDKRPRWRTSVLAGPPSPRRDLAVSLGINGNMLFPIMAGDRCEGIVVLSGKRHVLDDGSLEDSLASLGTEIGQFVLRSAAEKALSDSEERYRFAIQATRDVIWDWDLHTMQVRWNDGLTRAFGYRLDESVTTESWWRDKLHPDDIPGTLATVKAALAEKRSLWSVEYRMRRADGSYANIVNHGHIIWDSNGKATRMIGALQDVTERVQWEEALKQANATLEQRVMERTAELEELTVSLRLLTAKISQAEQSERRRLAQIIHDDLQQLLVAARMQVIMMQADTKGGPLAEKSKFAVELMDNAIEEARTLTTQLRPPALYESGLPAALRWLAGWIEQAHGFGVELDIDSSIDPLPEQDAVQLFDSVRELLLNSVKYSGAGKATVRMAQLDEDRIGLTVADDGAGFDIAELDRPRSNEGGGFGLFSIRERMLAMGGDFDIVSAPGEGTSIMLRWSRSLAVGRAYEDSGTNGIHLDASLAEREIGREPEGPDARLISVLLVDDHALIRQSLADIIRRQPDLSVVSESPDGESAIAEVIAHMPRVVIMDVNLPKLNGVQATRIIKERFPEITVIGISVHNDNATRQAMLEAGASDYLSKDGPVDTLLGTIRKQARSGFRI